MKQFYLLTCLLAGTFAFSQTLPSLKNIDPSSRQTDLLVTERMPFSNLAEQTEHTGMYSLVQAYRELANADTQKRFNDLGTLESAVRFKSNNETIFIGAIHTEFETVDSNSLRTDNNGNIAVKAGKNPFQKQQRTIIAPLSLHKRGLQTSFYLKEELITNTTPNHFTEILADFGDGKGFQRITVNVPIQVQYASEGAKEITFEAHLADGSRVTQKSTLYVTASGNDARNRGVNQQDIFSTIMPDLSIYAGANDFAGMGEYEIFLSPDSVLDKPIIIIDGFDPFDTRNIDAVYALLDYTDTNNTTQNLGDKVRNEEGFDVIILNLPQYLLLSDGVSVMNINQVTDTNGDMIIDENDYPAGSTLVDGGSDFIERNAMTLVTLLQTINTQKTGDEQNVIIGPSMGGLISRYALNYMENEGLIHDTRLWLSFDSPHLGANVPIGFQHLFNYLAYGLDTWIGNFSIDTLKPIVDGMLKSSAARQMLVDHFEAHLANGEIAEFNSSITLPTPHPYFTAFYNRIDNMTTDGFPQQPRLVSMINGSGQSNPYQDKNGNDILPGAYVLDAFLPGVAILTDAHLDVWFTPSAGQTIKVSDIWIDAPFLCFCDINAEADSQATASSAGVDAAMGGLFDLGALAAGFAGTDPVFDAFFGALTVDFFNFIPTISGMAMKDQPNWYATPVPNSTRAPNDTPFEAWYMPVDNEPHVTITEANVAFALSEIIQSTLADSSFELEDIAVENPVVDMLRVHLGQQAEATSLQLIDITGKQLMSHTVEGKGNFYEVPVALAQGMYLLRISSDGNTVTKKILVK